MRRTVLVLPLVGCFGYNGGVGPDAALDGRMGVALEAQTSLDTGPARVGPVARARVGPGWGDGGFGLDTCHRTYGWTGMTLCARLMALEFGGREGDFAFGFLSPSIAVGLWQPVHKRGVRNIVTDTYDVKAFEAKLTLGLDVRPLQRWQHTVPYVSITLGAGRGTSNY